MRAGIRHRLYHAVRVGLLLLSVASLVFGVRHFAYTIEEMRHAGPLELPEDEVVFRDTLVGALAEAVATFDFDGGIRQALTEEDYQKAETLHRVADAAVTLAADVARDYRLAMSGWAVVGRNSLDFARGSITGYGDGAFGLIGAVGTDLLVPMYGDARDAGIQLWRYAQGQEVDRIILGLAAIGLALPLMQAATDPLKAALRLRRTSPQLATQLRGLTEQAVDVPGLSAWLRRGNAGTDTAGVSQFVRRQGIEALGRSGSDVAGIFASGGRRATVAALRTAQHADDLTVFRRVAKTFGAEADGYITLLGRRLGMMYRTWGLSLPIAAKLLALGSLVSAAGVLLAAALSQDAALKLGKVLGLRWLARGLTLG